MPDQPAVWLVEIETAVAEIRAFTSGLDQSGFLASSLACSATAMQLIIIGEAARRLPQAVRDEATEIPWDKIVSLRNRVVHGYQTVDHKIVWEVVQEHLTPLEAAVRRMLAARGESSP